MTAMSNVVLRRLGPKGGVGSITLSRPERLNTLSLNMVRSINGALNEWLTCPNLKCLLLTGEGTKAFCAGGDVKSLVTDQGMSSSPVEHPCINGSFKFVHGRRGTLAADFFREEYNVDYTLAKLNEERMKGIAGSSTMPVQVSLWDGIVMGGGVGISAHGSYRIATERTLFAMPETLIGFFPDVGSSHFLSRLPGGLGLYLGLLGSKLRAEDLVYAGEVSQHYNINDDVAGTCLLVVSGIATHFVPSGDVNKMVDDLVLRDGEDVFNVLDDYSSPLDASGSYLATNREAIETCFAGKESVMDIMEALRSHGSEWSLGTLTKMKEKLSPTSLAITLRELRMGRELSLLECFQMEYRLSQRFVTSNDFREGVRAVLIDKNGAPPTWYPSSIDMVEKTVIDQYFAPLGEHEWSPPPTPLND